MNIASRARNHQTQMLLLRSKYNLHSQILRQKVSASQSCFYRILGTRYHIRVSAHGATFGTPLSLRYSVARLANRPYVIPDPDGFIGLRSFSFYVILGACFLARGTVMCNAGRAWRLAAGEARIYIAGGPCKKTPGSLGTIALVELARKLQEHR